VDVNATDFAGTQANLGVCTFAGQQYGGSTRRTRDLGTLAWQHLDAVYGGTDWNVADWQSVAGTDGSIDAGQQRGANFEAARSDDVATFAIGVAQQCDVRRTVGVVFETLDLGRNAVLVATEV